MSSSNQQQSKNNLKTKNPSVAPTQIYKNQNDPKQKEVSNRGPLIISTITKNKLSLKIKRTKCYYCKGSNHFKRNCRKLQIDRKQH